jgi:uncharacterized membrane protein
MSLHKWLGWLVMPEIKDALIGQVKQSKEYLNAYSIIFLVPLSLARSSLSDFLGSKIFLLYSKQGHVAFSQIWSNNFWRFLWFYVLMVLPILTLNIIFSGASVAQVLFLFFALTYFPRLFFVSCFIIDQNMLIFESVKASYRMSRGNIGCILGYMGIYILLLILIACPIMMIPNCFTLPALWMAAIIVSIIMYFALLCFIFGCMYASNVYMYRTLRQKEN